MPGGEQTFQYGALLGGELEPLLGLDGGNGLRHRVRAHDRGPHRPANSRAVPSSATLAASPFFAALDAVEPVVRSRVVALS